MKAKIPPAVPGETPIREWSSQRLHDRVNAINEALMVLEERVEAKANWCDWRLKAQLGRIEECEMALTYPELLATLTVGAPAQAEPACLCAIEYEGFAAVAVNDCPKHGVHESSPVHRSVNTPVPQHEEQADSRNTATAPGSGAAEQSSSLDADRAFVKLVYEIESDVLPQPAPGQTGPCYESQEDGARCTTPEHWDDGQGAPQRPAPEKRCGYVVLVDGVVRCGQFEIGHDGSHKFSGKLAHPGCNQSCHPMPAPPPQPKTEARRLAVHVWKNNDCPNTIHVTSALCCGLSQGLQSDFRLVEFIEESAVAEKLAALDALTLEWANKYRDLSARAEKDRATVERVGALIGMWGDSRTAMVKVCAIRLALAGPTAGKP